VNNNRNNNNRQDMENFIFQNPVKLIMGRGMIARLAKEIPSDKRIMITFGGGSVKKNGVYDQVKEALKNHYTVEFWGIEPNPAIETLRKAIAKRREGRLFISCWWWFRD
jgi:NADP-dependent alcohol dehydrogenase